MKTSNKILLIAFITLLVSVVIAMAYIKKYVSSDMEFEYKTDFEQTYALNANSLVDIEIKNCNARMEIESWDNDSILLQTSYFGNNSESVNQDISVVDTGAIIKFLGDHSTKKNKVALVIRVPKEVNIKYNVDGGAVKLNNLKGRVIGNAGGGIIRVDGLDGNIRLSTGGGIIDLKDVSGQGNVSTGGGKVSVSDAYGNFEVSTGGGSISVNSSKFDGKVSSGGGKLAFNQVSGNINISTGGGKITTEGCEILGTISTGGGEVTVNNARKEVKAKSGGGVLRLENVAGSIDAKTGGGKIYASVKHADEITDYHVDLKSGGGDISLTLPEELGYDFDIEIKAKKHDAKEYNIVNDFNLTQEIKESDEPGKVIILAKGVYGTGENKVVIRTNSSDIYLKK